MPEVYVKFNSLEEAMQALQGNTPVAAAPAPSFVPPAPQAAPVAPAALAYVPPAPVAHVAAAPVAPAPVAAPAATGITAAQVAAQAQAYAKAHGPKAAKAVFAEFGAGAVAQIAPEHYAAVMQRMAV